MFAILNAQRIRYHISNMVLRIHYELWGVSMKLYVNVKQAGTRKNYITKEEIVLEKAPLTLRELITATVLQNVKEFNEKLKKERLIDYLTNEQISERLSTGKAAFGTSYNTNEANLNKVLETAFLAYEDGLYRVFIGDKEAQKLGDSIELKEGETLTFIKLTMLAGGMW
jgi:hypothetical protein